MKVLITRPEPGASATARQVEQMGFEALLAPCLRIELVDARLPERPAAILVTSGQAVAALPARFHDIPAFSVGDATAARLRQAGFTEVMSAGGDAKDLLRLVTDRKIAGTHLLAVGQRQGVALAWQLRERGIRVMRRKLYAARPVAALPPAVRAALGAGEIAKALFYSAETARAFIRLQPPGTAGMEALALSQGIGAELRGLPWAAIRVALAPNEPDLLALLK